MAEPTLAQLAAALRSSWDLDTCDDDDAARWSPDNPSRGQCGVTALVLQDHLGGDLLLAEVYRPDGTQLGWHYGNRLPDGTDVDLTRGQFDADEHVGPPRVVSRPPGPPRRCAEQYAHLGRRVQQLLEGQTCGAVSSRTSA